MGTLRVIAHQTYLYFHNIVLAKVFWCGIAYYYCPYSQPYYMFLPFQVLEVRRVNWDVGSTIGSYIGLFFLVLAYTAIGVFCVNTFQKSDCCIYYCSFFMFYFLLWVLKGLQALFNSDIRLENFGMKAHFDSIARGILDTRDMIYFLSISVFFYWFTVFKLRKE